MHRLLTGTHVGRFARRGMIAPWHKVLLVATFASRGTTLQQGLGAVRGSFAFGRHVKVRPAIFDMLPGRKHHFGNQPGARKFDRWRRAGIPAMASSGRIDFTGPQPNIPQDVRSPENVSLRAIDVVDEWARNLTEAGAAAPSGDDPDRSTLHALDRIRGRLSGGTLKYVFALTYLEGPIDVQAMAAVDKMDFPHADGLVIEEIVAKPREYWERGIKAELLYTISRLLKSTTNDQVTLGIGPLFQGFNGQMGFELILEMQGLAKEHKFRLIQLGLGGGNETSGGS